MSDHSDQTAQAQSERALREANSRLLMLAEITNAITSTLDSNEALRRLARLVVPRLGDWCVVDLFNPPNRVERVAITHRDPSLVPREKYERVLPPLTEASNAPLAAVLHGHRTMLVTGIPGAEDPDNPFEQEERSLFAELGADTAVVAPLRARGDRIMGAVTVVRTDPERPFLQADLEIVDDVARRAALAVENGRLFEAQRDVAERLQLSMLPSLPQLDDIELAARYTAARRSSEVGGDWYDVFALPSGQTALIIGDVAGHDLGAAVKMGQLRNLLRALACDRLEPPGEVLGRLDRIASHLGVCETVSAVLAYLEGGDGEPWSLQWSNAGHPPPLVIRPGGDARFVEDTPEPLLGVLPARPRASHSAVLEGGSTLLLYTDGLVEATHRTITLGMAALADYATAHAGEPVERLVEGISSALGGAGSDDVAILAVRLPPQG